MILVLLYLFSILSFHHSHYSQPNYPNIPGLSLFPGNLIHSHSYREPDVYANQVVLVVGAGPSGKDILLDLSSHSKQLYFCNRGPTLTTSLPNNVCTVPEIYEVKEDGTVKLVDGQNIKVDSIIMATGYIFFYPFLSEDAGITVKEEGKRVTPLYKQTFCVSHPSLIFIGVNKSTIIPMLDFQVKWVKQVLTRKKMLPSKEEMISDDEMIFQKRLDRGISPKLAGHFLFLEMWNLMECWAKLGGSEVLSPIVRMVYEDSIYRRRYDLMHYKDINYCLLEKEKWLTRDEEEETKQIVV